jgi:hypothetical protein
MTKVRVFAAVALGLVTGYLVWGAVVLVLLAIFGVYRVVPAAGVWLGILIAAAVIAAIRYRKAGNTAAALFACSMPILPTVTSAYVFALMLR